MIEYRGIKLKKKNVWHEETTGRGHRMPRSVEIKCISHFLFAKDVLSYMIPLTKAKSSVENFCQMRLERIEFMILCDLKNWSKDLWAQNIKYYSLNGKMCN